MIESKRVNTRRFYYNNLFKDYIFNFEKISEFYQYDYRKIDSYNKRLLDLEKNYDDKNRFKIYNILKKYNESIGCGLKTIENIEKLKSRNSAVIIGGQQPGFLTGPIFIIYKILTILKLSNYFQEKLKIPVIPCFWNASDDSNLNQVDNLNVISDNKIINIQLNLSEFEGKTRISNVYLTQDRFNEAIGKLESILYSTDFKSEVINFYKNRVTEAFKNNSGIKRKISISNFFSNLVTKMFSDYGIVIVDPADTKLKELSFDLLESDVNNHYTISSLISSAAEKLNKYGYHNQLNSIPETLDFFYCLEGLRHKIYSVNKNLFEIKDKRYSRDELSYLFKENPSNISLNVVLRPLLQDKLLPVLCSVSGPGETGYFAQLKSVYDLYGLKMPVIHPRFSATIIEKKIKRVITKLQILDEELKLGKEEMIKQIVVRRTKINPPELMQELENDIQKGIKKVEDVFANLKIDISSSFDRIKRNTGKEIKVLNKKIYSELKKKNDIITESINKLYTNVFPNNNLQEREINITTYLNKYGPGFIDELYSVIKPFDFSHKFLEIM